MGLLPLQCGALVGTGGGKRRCVEGEHRPAQGPQPGPRIWGRTGSGGRTTATTRPRWVTSIR